MKKGVTLLLTLHKPKSHELLYWSKKMIEVKKYKNIEMKVLVDNPDLDWSWLFGEQNVFVNVENLGKFATVYNFIKSGRVETTHFKTVDPDDFVFLDRLSSSIGDISSENNIYLFNSRKVRSHSEKEAAELQCKDWKHLFDMSTTYKYMTFGTSWTILPTKPILNDTYYEKSMDVRNWMEDQMLGLIALSNKSKVLRIDLDWYIYNFNDGLSTRVSEDDKNEILRTIDACWAIFNKSGLVFDTPFPHELSYLINLVETSDIEDKKNFIEELEMRKFSKIFGREAILDYMN